MRYVKARLDTEYQDITYRIFVTEYLKGLGRFGGKTYRDAIAEYYKPVETRTADEIIGGIKNKLSQLGGEK